MNMQLFDHSKLLLSPEKYISNREAYDYEDLSVSFYVEQTGHLNTHGEYHGIYLDNVPRNNPKGINYKSFYKVAE